jgi:hypothetical protein
MSYGIEVPKVYASIVNIKQHHTSSFRSLTWPDSLLARAAPSSIVATRSANLRVLIVSIKESVSGFICTNINVFAWPPVLQENKWLKKYFEKNQDYKGF